MRRAEGQHLVGLVVQRVQALAGRIGQPELGAGDQVDQRVVLEQRDVGRAAHALDQHLLHGRAGGVGHVHDAALAVAAFARQVQVAAFFREGHAEFAQPADGLRRAFDHEARGLGVAQAGAGHQRVFHVGVEAVARRQHGRDAALRPGAGAVVQRALGEHGHAVRGGQVQRGGEACEAAADNEDVEVANGGSHRRGNRLGQAGE
ncbi:hypothetical protein D3C72_1296190 [compost metagenome]